MTTTVSANLWNLDSLRLHSLGKMSSHLLEQTESYSYSELLFYMKFPPEKLEIFYFKWSKYLWIMNSQTDIEHGR